MGSELKLLPCPFCGSSELANCGTVIAGKHCPSIGCIGCGLLAIPGTKFASESEGWDSGAIESWNTRQADTTLERVKELKERLKEKIYERNSINCQIDERVASDQSYGLEMALDDLKELFPELLEGQSKETG